MFYIIIYILLSAISVILRGKLGNNMPPMLLVFIASSFAIVIFSSISIKMGSCLSHIFLQHKYNVLSVNLIICIVWIGSFLIPVYFTPSIQIMTFMSIVSLLGVAFLFSKSKRSSIFIIFFLLLINLIMYYITLYSSYSSIKYVVLVLSTIATGAFGWLYNKISARFNQQKVSAIEILSLRFWGLWLVSLIYIIYKHQIQHLTLTNLLQGIIVGSISLIIPIYFSQKSIEKIGPNLTSTFMGLAPGLTFFLEVVFYEDYKITSGFMFSITLFFILLLLYFIQNKFLYIIKKG